MMELTIFFQWYNEQYGGIENSCIVFMEQYSPQIWGTLLIGIVVLCLRELYIAFHVDKVSKNKYNKEKERK